MAGLRVLESRYCVDEVALRAEVYAVCPVTGIVDRYEAVIRYRPPRTGSGCRFLEALSLQGFLDGFRGRRLLQEEIASMIVEEVCGALGRGASVEVVLRGGHGPVEMEVRVSRECGG